MLAVGMNGADREQLRRLVTNEDPRHVFFARDASGLSEVEARLAAALCSASITDGVRQRVKARNQERRTCYMHPHFQIHQNKYINVCYLL